MRTKKNKKKAETTSSNECQFITDEKEHFV